MNYDLATQVDPVTGYPDYCADGTLGITCAISDEIYNFDFTGYLPNTHDVDLEILDQPIQLPEYGQLPEFLTASPSGTDKMTLSSQSAVTDSRIKTLKSRGSQISPTGNG